MRYDVRNMTSNGIFKQFVDVSGRPVCAGCLTRIVTPPQDWAACNGCHMRIHEKCSTHIQDGGTTYNCCSSCAE